MHAESNTIKLNDFVATALAHPRRWILPVLVVLIASLCYALLKAPEWEAAQSLVVRNEATSSSSQLGKFEGLDAMKNAQETVMAIAKSRSVVEAALKNVDENEPTARDIDDAAEHISLSAPGGIEFGKSEVLRLAFVDSNRQRAIDMNRELGIELERQLQQLRDRRGKSLEAELREAVELARDDLVEATRRLAAVEHDMGEDLAELRSLSEYAGGNSNLRTRQTNLENELRGADLSRRDMEQLLATLQQMDNDPQRLLATPTTLLNSQPTLQRLKQGLTEAQLRTAQLKGSMSELHPLVIAARDAEAEVQARVRGELSTAISGMQMELSMQKTRTELLKHQLTEVRERLQRIASQRATYQNLVLEVRDRNEILKQAQQQLATARSSRAAAHSTSMLTRIDGPSTGSHPVGPRKAYIVIAGLFGGLFFGVGVVFLTTKAGAAEAYLHAKQGDEVDLAEVDGASSHVQEAGLVELAATIQPQIVGWQEHAIAWRESLLRSLRSPSEN